MSCHYSQHHCNCTKEEDCEEYQATAAAAASTSTPFVSAPSSPRHSYSAAHEQYAGLADATPENISDFDFSVRIFGPDSQLLSPISSVNYPASAMSTAEELFHNGKIKPLDTSFLFSCCCTCFKHAVHEGAGYCDDLLPLVNLHTYDDPVCPPVFAASKDISAPPQNAVDEHVDAAPLLASGKIQGQAFKLSSSESGLELWRKGPAGPARGRDAEKLGTPRHVDVHLRHVGGGVTQIASLPKASHNKSTSSGGGRQRHVYHRRARSLSPLRVFHMDDMIFQPRPSFESELLYSHMSSRRAAAAADQADIPHGDNLGSSYTAKPARRRKSRKSWTLKELLNLGVDNRVHTEKKPNLGGKFGGHAADQLHPPKFGKKGDKERNIEKRADSTILKKKITGSLIIDKGSSAEGSLHSQSSKQDQLLTTTEGAVVVVVSSPWKLQREDVLKHAEDHHITNESHAEESCTKKRTLLPYKKSLLACLGFSSKLSSVKGLHAMPNFNAV